MLLVFARLFTFGTLVVLWNWLLDREHDMGPYLGMAFAAFCPGAVYFHAGFPMAAATFFLCVTFAALRRGRYGWAAIAGLLGATTYPLMVLLGPLAAGWILLDRPEEAEPTTPWPRRLWAAALVGGCTVAGGVLVVLVMRAQTGEWDAFFTVQSTYPTSTQWPWQNWYGRVHHFWNGAVGMVGLTAPQAGLVGGTLVVVAVNELRAGLRGIRLLILGWAVFVVWAVPLTLGQYSIWRTDTLVLPVAVLVARLPRLLAVLAVLGAMALVGPMAALYVQGDLI